LASFGHPSKFQPVSRLGFVTAPMSLNGGQQNFAGCLAVSWATFLGILPLTEICQLQTSLCVQVLRSLILAALLHGTRPAGVSQTLWCTYKEWSHGTSAEGATYRMGGHHVGHWPTFQLFLVLFVTFFGVSFRAVDLAS